MSQKKFNAAMHLAASGLGMLEAIFAENKLLALREGEQLPKAPVEVTNPPRPEGKPDGAFTWRENVGRLEAEIAASPLPTRQLKRMAARTLARTLSTVQKQQERKDRVLAKKRARAAAKYAASLGAVKNETT